MPDHLHLLLSPYTGIDITEAIQRFKTFTTNLSWKFGCEGKLWQRSYYDHVIRKREELLEVCEYILANPVRKELVGKPGDWRYSAMPDNLPL